MGHLVNQVSGELALTSGLSEDAGPTGGGREGPGITVWLLYHSPPYKEAGLTGSGGKERV